MATARERPPEEAAEDTSFARGLRLILTVADRGELRADELSGVLEMPLSSVYRYLRTLTEFGFIDRRDGRYRLGPRLSIGSGSKVTSQRLVRIADPVLRLLALHQVEARDPLRVSIEPGTMTPLYAGAPARVLLAFAPPEILEEVVAGLLPLTPETPSEAILRDGLAEIVRTGFAASEGEFIAGAVAIAVPIMRDDGIVAALAVTGPSSRCGLEWQARTRRLLGSAAETIVAAIADEAPV
jgi:DNA-binding IclR family transcriptional regulator